MNTDKKMKGDLSKISLEIKEDKSKKPKQKINNLIGRLDKKDVFNNCWFNKKLDIIEHHQKDS